MTSKCGKNKNVGHEAIAECVTGVFATFWRLLWSFTEQTHCNMESTFLWDKETNYCRKTFYYKIFNITQNPTFEHFSNMIRAIWGNLLSIQNEALSLVAMSSKELWLVQENHFTVTLESQLKTYIESRIKLRNLQVLKKMLQKSSQFLSSEQPCEPKSLDVAFNIARFEKIPSEDLRLRSTMEAIRFGFWVKGALVTMEICVLCGWRLSN